eukprot:UN0475
MDFLDKTDAYVKVTMGGKEVMKTKVIDNNLSPVWDAKAAVHWDGINDLIFTVMDSDLFTSDDCVGQYVLTKGHIRQGFKGTVPLDVSKRFKGGVKQPSLTIRVVPGDVLSCSVM